MAHDHQIIATKKGPPFYVGGDSVYLDAPADNTRTIQVPRPGVVSLVGVVLRLKNTDQKKFVANPWTLEENQRPFMSYKGSFYA